MAIQDDAPKIIKRIDNAAKVAEIDIRKAQQQSLSFLRRFATRVGRRDAGAGRNQLMREYKKTQKVKPGHMYLFGYDPKYKDKLAVYDKFPLIFVIGLYKNGFLGLNLHFVHPKIRQQVFTLFLKNAIRGGNSEIKRLRLNYGLSLSLAGSEIIAPMIKRYLWKQLDAPMVEVPPEHWPYVIFLPMERMIRK